MSYLTEKFITWYKKQKRLIQIGLPVGVLLPFLIPYVNILYVFPFMVLVVFGINYIFKKFLPQEMQKRVVRVAFLLPTSFVIFSFLFLSTILTSPSRDLDGQVAGVTEENQKLQAELEAERKAREEAERQKQEAEEKAEAERQAREDLQKQIETVTSTNEAITNKERIEGEEDNNIDEVIQANTATATTEESELVQVLSVVDGDTVKVENFGTLRLIGMDTPETKDPRKPVQCFGEEATNKARELLENKKVRLRFDNSKARLDKYNRTLAYVIREDGFDYNMEMVKQGYAHSYKQYPHPRLEEFNQVENEAKDGKAGFWATDTCDGDTEQPKKEPEPEPTPAPAPRPQPDRGSGGGGGGYIAGSCKKLREQYGIGNFRPGNPNYTAGRDRDNDGIACEM